MSASRLVINSLVFKKQRQAYKYEYESLTSSRPARVLNPETLEPYLRPVHEVDGVLMDRAALQAHVLKPAPA